MELHTTNWITTDDALTVEQYEKLYILLEFIGFRIPPSLRIDDHLNEFPYIYHDSRDNVIDRCRTIERKIHHIKVSYSEIIDIIIKQLKKEVENAEN